MKSRMNPVLWQLLVPAVDTQYRWRVQSECVCIQEVYTQGDHHFPDERQYLDPLIRLPLPPGEIWCPTDHGAPKPYREIVEWIDHEVREFPPDPEENPYEFEDADVWPRIRRTEAKQSALWRVRLTCGHYYEHVHTDVDWRPEHGPKRATEERSDEMRKEFEDIWAGGADAWPREGIERDHVRRMLDQRWPCPSPEQSWSACAHAQQITPYQRVGWLVARAKQSGPGPTQRQRLEAQLRRAEAEAHRLQAQA
ncbi:MAG: hypothetical protein IPL43_04390 [Micropruina sp.]|nr:hypothetical protein [Micropruina sp.]